METKSSEKVNGREGKRENMAEERKEKKMKAIDMSVQEKGKCKEKRKKK